MFSADYRRALAAEAAGDYTEASKGYALAGDRLKVAEMHLLRAAGSASPEVKLSERRAALLWADAKEPTGREQAIWRRVARALADWAATSGLIGQADRDVARQAAQLFVSSGDPAGAGECYEMIGDDASAADA